MDLFIAWDGDHIGRQVGQLALVDDEEGLRRVSQAIENGNRIWASWVNEVFGDLVSYGGDEGRARVPADRLDELNQIRQKYASAVGSPVSVGVGVRLSEADRALMAAKLKGGDQIVLYTPEVEQTLAQARQKSESDKLFDEYLKSERTWGRRLRKDGDQEPQPPEPETTAPTNNASAGGGYTPIHGQDGGGGAPQPPMQEASEHSQGEAMQAMADDTSPPEMTHSAADFEDALHDHAQEQDQKDSDDQQKQDQGNDIRQKVVEILMQVRQQAPQMEQLREQAPDLYTAMQGAVAALLMMAKVLVGGDGQSDSEKVVEQQGGEQPQEGSSVQKSERGRIHEFYRKRGECKHFHVKWGGITRCVRCKKRAGASGMKKSECNHVWFPLVDSTRDAEVCPNCGEDRDVERPEPLEKMAVIHDDPSKPMMVWRVEDDSGEGPHAMGLWPKPVKHRPSAQDDFGQNEYDEIMSQPEDVGAPRFGFLTQEDAHRWFNTSKMWDRLKREGHQLVQVPAAKVWRSQSGRQVAFIPHQPESLEKASPNVRAHRNNLTREQVGQRMEAYANRNGFQVGRPVLESANITRNVIHPSANQPVSHELGHALMTPEGQTAGQYTRKLARDGSKERFNDEGEPNEAREDADYAEDVAQVMEPGIARRAGVAPALVATQFSPNPHDNARYVHLYDDIDPGDPRSTHANLLEDAQHHLNQVDTGQKVFKRGRALPGTSIDAKINARAAAQPLTQKAELPATPTLTPPPKPAAPALHSTVEGFMGGLKAIPKEDAVARGKFVTSHMSHPPFVAALQAHPQGPKVHGMLMGFLNSKVNAGVKPGQTQVTVKSAADLEKGKLPMPESAPKHNHLHLPVGSTKDGKVKVEHGEGKQGWVSVRAGQVLSNDGHPVSSRNPGGR